MNWTTIQTMIGYPLYDLIEEAWCLLSGYEDGIYGKCVKVIYLRGGITVPLQKVDLRQVSLFCLPHQLPLKNLTLRTQQFQVTPKTLIQEIGMISQQ